MTGRRVKPSGSRSRSGSSRRWESSAHALNRPAAHGGQKVSSPYSVILGRNEPALFLYFYASAKHQLDERAKAHLDGFMEHLEIGNEQTVGDTKMCTAYFKGDTAEARSHMEWYIASMFGELMPDCGIYFLREGRSYMTEDEHKKILCNMKDYAICVVKLVWEKADED